MPQSSANPQRVSWTSNQVRPHRVRKPSAPLLHALGPFPPPAHLTSHFKEPTKTLLVALWRCRAQPWALQSATLSSLPSAGEVAGPTPGPDRGLPTAPAPVPGYPGQPGGTGPDTGCLRFAVELPVPGFLVSPPQRLPSILVGGNTPVGEPALLTPPPGPSTPEVQGGACPPSVSRLQPTP